MAMEYFLFVISRATIFDCLITRQFQQLCFEISSYIVPDCHQLHTVVQVHLVFRNSSFAKFTRMASFADAVPWFAALVVVDIVDFGDFSVHAVFAIVAVISALSDLGTTANQEET